MKYCRYFNENGSRGEISEIKLRLMNNNTALHGNED